MDKENNKLNFKFKAKEIALPTLVGIATVAIILVIFFLAILGTYGSAMSAAPNDRLKKAGSYAKMVDETDKDGVVFFGDSITEMYNLDAFYPNKGYINRGIGGDLTTDLIRRAKTNVIALRPKAVVLLVGTNDLNTRTVDDTATSYYELLKILTDSLPETRLIVQSVLPICTLSYPFSHIMISNRTNEKITALNEKIKSFCAEIKTDSPNLDIIYVDTHATLLDGDKLNEIYALDGLHVNNYGYSAITGVLSTYL